MRRTKKCECDTRRKRWRCRSQSSPQHADRNKSKCEENPRPASTQSLTRQQPGDTYHHSRIHAETLAVRHHLDNVKQFGKSVLANERKAKEQKREATNDKPEECAWTSKEQRHAEENCYLRLRSEEHTSELQSHSFISYAVFCLKKKHNQHDA